MDRRLLVRTDGSDCLLVAVGMQLPASDCLISAVESMFCLLLLAAGKGTNPPTSTRRPRRPPKKHTLTRPQDIRLGFTRISNMSTAERQWRQNWHSGEKGDKGRMQPLHLLTGSVLPLLPTIQKVAESHRGKSGRLTHLKVGVCHTQHSGVRQL